MSTLKFGTWENPDGTENYKCRAWVNFNGTGTVAIRASGNVSSITDNGVGNYTVNFTTAMPDADYSLIPAHGIESSANGSHYDTLTTTSARVYARAGTGTLTDPAVFSVIVNR